jgi:hypothetical protein
VRRSRSTLTSSVSWPATKRAVVNEKDVARAIAIASEEIEVRKALGDY